jgi:two-component system, chemotaxis family, sensor kinase CheA
VNDYPQEFLDLFRDEANGRLDNMIDALLALESRRAGPETVNSLFRDAHTIKGGAGMLDLEDVRNVAHAVEDLLDVVRENGDFPLELIETLLRSVDTMRGQLMDERGAAPDLLHELEERRRGLSPDVGGGGTVEVEPDPDTDTAASRRRAIRIPAEKIDRLLDLVGESVQHRRRLEHVLGDEISTGDETLSDELDLGERLLDDLKDAAIGMRTLPLSSIVGPMPRAVRDLAVVEGKQVELEIIGMDTELDRTILEGLSDLIVHLLRNAVGHGIELPVERELAGKPAVGSIELHAVQRGGSVEIVVADDGRGVSREALLEARSAGGSLADVLTRPGFSTAGEVTALSGRGVGLDAVKRRVEAFGGSLDVRSDPGRGLEVVMQLPLALALLDVLLVERGANVFGIPLGSVDEALLVTDTLTTEGRPSLPLAGRVVPLADLADLLGVSLPPLDAPGPAVVVAAGGSRSALLCDRLLGEDEVVVKPLGPLLAGVPGYLGAALLGDGRVALLLDPQWLVRVPARRPQPPVSPAPPGEWAKPKVLVVEDSFTVRELQRSILEAAGYLVETARDGREGLDCLLADEEIELVLTDVEMPELDGFELTRAIRADRKRGSTPVVILTSRGDDEDHRRGLEAGADAYMVKRSFDQHALLETVERLVGR